MARLAGSLVSVDHVARRDALVVVAFFDRERRIAAGVLDELQVGAQAQRIPLQVVLRDRRAQIVGERAGHIAALRLALVKELFGGAAAGKLRPADHVADLDLDLGEGDLAGRGIGAVTGEGGGAEHARHHEPSTGRLHRVLQAKPR